MKSSFDHKPAVVEDLGNGSFYYNYNIVERTEEAAPASQGDDPEGTSDQLAEDPGTRTTYDCNSVQVWTRPDYKTVTRAVIREEISETEEFGLINDYNAASLGLMDKDEKAEAVARYKAYLSRVAEIKEMVKADLAAAGY